MNNDAVLIENRALFVYIGSALKFITLVTYPSNLRHGISTNMDISVQLLCE